MFTYSCFSCLLCLWQAKKAKFRKAPPAWEKQSFALFSCFYLPFYNCTYFLYVIYWTLFFFSHCNKECWKQIFIVCKIKTYVLPLCYQSIYPSLPLSSLSLHQCHLHHYIVTMSLWPLHWLPLSLDYHCVLSSLLCHGHSLPLSHCCGVTLIIAAVEDF